MKVLVAGGGIGGLTTALSLHKAGFDVEVIESVPELRPLGVGINLLPHAVRELDELGLRPRLEAAGVRTAELCYFSKHGRLVWREPRGVDAGYRWPQISIHRGTLQMTLLDAVRERLGADRVRTGSHLVGVDDQGEQVVARVRDHATGGERTVPADILVGADGIHSALRGLLYPDEGKPHWNGAILWRGVSRGAPFLTGRSMIMAGHASHKFVCYPISEPAPGSDEALINWIAELRFDETELAEREDWNKPGDLADFLPQFEEWRFDWLDVPGLIRGAERVYVYPMVDRDPVDRWSFGRITLLGDAAHPMYPIGSTGASQAILDAATLTGCLRSIDDPVKALAAYEEARLGPTANIVLANRKQGPEECMTLVEERAPDGFDRLDDVIAPDELAAIADKYKRLAGFSIEELNARPSLADVRY